MSNAGLDNWKTDKATRTIEVLTWPTGLHCSACGYALVQDNPCDRHSETAAVACTNSDCANKGLRLRVWAIRIPCEVLADAAP